MTSALPYLPVDLQWVGCSVTWSPHAVCVCLSLYCFFPNDLAYLYVSCPNEVVLVTHALPACAVRLH